MSMEAWAAPASGVPAEAPEGTSMPPGSPAAATATAPSAASAPGVPAGSAATSATVSRLELLGGDIPFRPLGMTEMLDGAIATIRRNPKAVLGLSIVIAGTVQVVLSIGSYLLIGEGARDELTPIAVMRSLGAQATLSAIGLLLSAFGILLLAGLLAPIAGRTIFSLPVTMSQAWREARPRLPRLIGTAILTMLLSFVALAIPIAPFLAALGSDAPAAVGVLTGLIGIPIGIALMIWVYVLYVLAVPAVVMEGQGLVHSMRRAHQLSRDRWWRTCGTLLLALLITFFMGFFALRVPFVVLQFVFFADDTSHTALVLSLTIDTIGRIVSWSLISPFDAGVIALIYVDRRMRREGFDLEVQTRASAPEADFLDLWRPSPLVPPPGTPRAPSPPPPAGLLDHMRPGVIFFPPSGTPYGADPYRRGVPYGSGPGGWKQ